MIYNKLSASYDQLYLEALNEFKASVPPEWGGASWFVDFYPSLGVKPGESPDLLFYGHAVNGWRSGFSIETDSKLTLTKVADSIKASNSYYAELSHTPLDWVNVCYSKSLFAHYRTLNTSIEQFYGGYGSYWTYRSFFWNVVWKLTCDYHSIDRAVRDWSEQTVWSNLYKIWTEEGNPDEYLKGVQLKGATELVKKEIEELKPKYCIVLTNIS